MEMGGTSTARTLGGARLLGRFALLAYHGQLLLLLHKTCQDRKFDVTICGTGGDEEF